MRKLSQLVGFPANRGYVFRLDGTCYRVGRSGVETLELAGQILASLDEGQSLWPLRARIRAVRAENCTAVLAHMIQTTPHDRLRRIGLWLRAQMSGHLGTEIVARFVDAEDERLRAATAKALRRMSAWDVLTNLATADPSARVRQLASFPARAEFSTRLHEYVNQVTPLTVAPRHQPLWLAPWLELRRPMRGKSVELIRRILEQIRRLVRE